MCSLYGAAFVQSAFVLVCEVCMGCMQAAVWLRHTNCTYKSRTAQIVQVRACKRIQPRCEIQKYAFHEMKAQWIMNSTAVKTRNTCNQGQSESSQFCGWLTTHWCAAAWIWLTTLTTHGQPQVLTFDHPFDWPIWEHRTLGSTVIPMAGHLWLHLEFWPPLLFSEEGLLRVVLCNWY